MAIPVTPPTSRFSPSGRPPSKPTPGASAAPLLRPVLEQSVASPDHMPPRLVARYLSWRARRETVRMLNRLDGSTLRDLGITDIESQVYGAPQDRRRAYDPDWWRKK